MSFDIVSMYFIVSYSDPQVHDLRIIQACLSKVRLSSRNLWSRFALPLCLFVFSDQWG